MPWITLGGVQVPEAAWGCATESQEMRNEAPDRRVPGMLEGQGRKISLEPVSKPFGIDTMSMRYRYQLVPICRVRGKSLPAWVSIPVIQNQNRRY